MKEPASPATAGILRAWAESQTPPLAAGSEAPLPATDEEIRQRATDLAAEGSSVVPIEEITAAYRRAFAALWMTGEIPTVDSVQTAMVIMRAGLQNNREATALRPQDAETYAKVLRGVDSNPLLSPADRTFVQQACRYLICTDTHEIPVVVALNEMFERRVNEHYLRSQRNLFGLVGLVGGVIVGVVLGWLLF